MPQKNSEVYLSSFQLCYAKKKKKKQPRTHEESFKVTRNFSEGCFLDLSDSSSHEVYRNGHYLPHEHFLCL